MSPTPAQLRAARAWIGLSRGQAAAAAGVCLETLARAERGDPTVSPSSLQQVAAIYHARGFTFGAVTLARGVAA